MAIMKRTDDFSTTSRFFNCLEIIIFFVYVGTSTSVTDEENPIEFNDATLSETS
jgi:hypothetical protein